MLIRQDFCPKNDLPPRMYLEQVMDGISKVYCYLWDHKNNDNKFAITWKELAKLYNKNCFRTSIRKLNNQGLLSYDEDDEGISIELVGWDEMVSGM